MAKMKANGNSWSYLNSVIELGERSLFVYDLYPNKRKWLDDYKNSAQLCI